MKGSIAMAYQIFKPIASVQGALFDMDGVILDSEGLYTRFWREAAAAFGYDMSYTQAIGLRGLNRETAARQLEGYFGPGIDYIQIRNKRTELMDAFVGSDSIPPKPGIHTLLDALKSTGIPTAICTASPRERVKKYLDPIGLFDRFDAIVTTYDVQNGKPAPDIYLKGAEVLGVHPCRCIAMEDSKAGLLSASSAGCMTIMVPDQDQPDEEDLHRIHALCDSLTDVVGLIRHSPL